MRRALVLVMLVAGALLALAPGVALADAIVEPHHEVDFPRAVDLRVEILSERPIVTVELFYRIGELGAIKHVTEPIEPGRDLTVRHTFDLSRVEEYIPPGTTVRYYWRVIDDGGEAYRTGLAEVKVVDDRFEWQAETDGKIAVFYHAGDAEFAKAILAVAQTALARLQVATGLEVKQPVPIYVYASEEELRGALGGAASAVPAGTIGLPFAGEGVILLGVPPTEEGFANAMLWLPNDVAQVLIRRATYNPYGPTPIWLDQGLSQVAEGGPSDAIAAAFVEAVARKRILPVRSLGMGFPSERAEAIVAYGQSFSLVDFLLRQGGPASLGRLLATFAEGESTDEALTSVYGFGLDELETRWRGELGGMRLLKATPFELLPTATPLPPRTNIGATDAGSSEDGSILDAVGRLFRQVFGGG